MKRLINVMVLVSTLLIIMSPGAQAYQYTIKLDALNGIYYSPGGEFTVIPVTGGLQSVLPYYAPVAKNIDGMTNTFETFCVETRVDFYPANWGGPTYSANISDYAIGGNIRTGSNNPLTLGAAWLYYEFATGKLQGYDYTGSGRHNDASALQEAIWIFMRQDHINSSFDPPNYNNIFLTEAATAVGSANVFNPSNGRYGVHVLNLYDANGSPAQNQLVLTPEPTSIILLGMGLIGLVVVRRKMQ